MNLSFKFTEIPPFTKRDEDALLFNQDGVLEYYIPEDYFGSGKSNSAEIEGAYVKLMGSFTYRIIDENSIIYKRCTNITFYSICKTCRFCSCFNF